MRGRNDFWYILLGLLLLTFQPLAAEQNSFTPSRATSAYLFAYTTGYGLGDEAIRFAISNDGYDYSALNGNHPVIGSDTGLSSGVRDPHIVRGRDGKSFYMVVADMSFAKGRNTNSSIVLLHSTDLIRWKSSTIDFSKRFPVQFGKTMRVWAPKTIFDPVAKKYMVYFSLRKEGEGEYDKIYYCYVNRSFNALEAEPRPLNLNQTQESCLNPTIVFERGQYHLFYATAGNVMGIKKATASKLGGVWTSSDRVVQQTSKPVEDVCVFKKNNSPDWMMEYTLASNESVQFAQSSDLENFESIDRVVNMDFQPRQGSITTITCEEADRLKKQWTQPSELFRTAKAEGLHSLNIVVDDREQKVIFPVKSGVDLASFKPDFELPDWAGLRTLGTDFARGRVRYALTIGNRKFAYSAEAVTRNNPVINGYYADPEVLYSQKTSKFYIYPTSDGFTNWEGTSFNVFSSENLRDWTNDGTIIQLGKSVVWAKKRAWAPCIIEKKIEQQYKYFFYFCAEQKIGVAVSDAPTGPFVDLGRPLLDQRPDGFKKRGQVIDPDVFQDPQSGKCYLYWGNGYMAGAELNEDMVSIKPETITELSPPKYTEGTYVFYRKGWYYFMWSQNDTRDPNYCVRYGYSKSPLDKITIPEDNIILQKDTSAGIFATGHNSVLQLPGKDEWYMVYHRFVYPNGINMGRPAGYHREVCMDVLEFNADGTIKPVKPTHAGVAPIR